MSEEYSVEAMESLEKAVKFCFSKLEGDERGTFPSHSSVQTYVRNIDLVKIILIRYKQDSYVDLLGEVRKAVREKLGLTEEDATPAKRGRTRLQEHARDIWKTKPVPQEQVKKVSSESNGVQSGADYFKQVIDKLSDKYDLEPENVRLAILASSAGAYVTLSGLRVVDVENRVRFYVEAKRAAEKLASPDTEEE